VAPLPVNVAEAPEHIAVDDAEAVIVGVTLTVSRTVPVRVHPTEFVPDAEYVVVDPGVTVTIDPVKAPGLHV
jgi:hypothetical protein